MDTSSVWDFLSNLTIGTLVAWVVVICTIIGVICTGIAKLFKVFTKYKEMKERDEEQAKALQKQQKRIEAIEADRKEINEKIDKRFDEIQRMLDEQRETRIINLRHDITLCGERALANGKISIREYKSLHEMVNEYINKYHQNYYVKSLIEKVDRDVEVVGKLDEHGRDIEDDEYE